MRSGIPPTTTKNAKRRREGDNTERASDVVGGQASTRSATHRFEPRDVGVDVVVHDIVALDAGEEVTFLSQKRGIALDGAHVPIKKVLLLLDELLHGRVKVKAELAVSTRRRCPPFFRRGVLRQRVEREGGEERTREEK